MRDLVLYSWKTVNAKAVEQQLDVLLASQRARIAARLKRGSPYTWKNFITLLDDMEDELHKLQSPLAHLTSVMTSRDPALREATRRVYDRCLEKLSGYATELLQHKGLYLAYQHLSKSREYSRLTEEQQTVVSHAIVGAKLSGVELPSRKRKRYKQIEMRLSKLEEKFANNLKDATGAWERHIWSPSLLAGIPLAARSAAKKAARERKLRGYLFSLGDATFQMIMESAKNRGLRREFYEAWIARATGKDTNSRKWNNGPIMKEILSLRHERALLLGYANHAEVSLEYKMAENPERVLSFLNKLGTKARPAALRELKKLAAYALEHDGIETLEPWDINYYMREVRAEKCGITQEELRKYFPLPKVLEGMFTTANLLYGITFKERVGIELWHQDAKFYDVFSPEGELIGGIYIDLFERPGEKNCGAWMDTAVIRRELFDESIQLPVGYLICNFSPGENDGPALLTMPEIEILFHEFGHNLHLLLTEAHAVGVSGIVGIQDDGVELPSQFMEIICWQWDVIKLISGHSETGERLPYEIFKKIRAARKFGFGLYVTWMVTRSLYDFRLHMEYDPERPDFVHELYQEMHDDPQPIYFSEYPWTPESFTHAFEYGYEAGYYGYLWSEVLAADAQSKFINRGRIDWSIGKIFQRQLLSRGGSRTLMASYLAFRGRKPRIDALLRWYGFIK